MKLIFKISRNDKDKFKINNQQDKGFDLIILDDKLFEKYLNKLNYCYKRNIIANIAWEFKNQYNTFKVYNNVEILSTGENFNPMKNKFQGHVIRFKTESVDFYTSDDVKVNEKVYQTNKKFKPLSKLDRALKISNIHFNI